jgi:hypothetical protein
MMVLSFEQEKEKGQYQKLYQCQVEMCGTNFIIFKNKLSKNINAFA